MRRLLNVFHPLFFHLKLYYTVFAYVALPLFMVHFVHVFNFRTTIRYTNFILDESLIAFLQRRMDASKVVWYIQCRDKVKGTVQ